MGYCGRRWWNVRNTWSALWSRQRLAAVGLKMIEASNGVSVPANERVEWRGRLAVLLMSLWKSGQSYDPLRHSRAQESSAEVTA
jgi:hypothetical protein